MDYLFLVYILISFWIGIGGTQKLIEYGKPTAAVLFIVGAIIVLIFFGLRWFSNEQFKIGKIQTNKWPPVVNMCPDFLTSYERTVNGVKEKICVDLIGVAPAGGIRKLTSPEQTTIQNADAYIFKLFNNLSGRKRTQALCVECKNKKVTWEGIYDGVTCVTGFAPGGSEDENCEPPAEV
jgi:hypothetical protein